MNRHSITKSLLAVVPAAALSFGGCANQDRGPSASPEQQPVQPAFDEPVDYGQQQPEDMQQQEPEQSAALGPVGQDNPMSGEIEIEAQGPQATDDITAAQSLQPGEIVGIAMTLDQGEIELSTLARGKLTNAQVKSFAGDLIAHHQRSMENYRQMSERQNVQAKIDTEMVEKLQAKVRQSREQLDGLSGAELDRQFLQTQVEMHEDAQRKLQEKLIPAAQNEALKSQLQKQAKAVEQHLERARTLQRQIQGPAS